MLTRFDLNGLFTGVSDIAALRAPSGARGADPGVRHLDAKLHLFGDESAIATSANLTEAALVRNHEFGFFADAAETLSAPRPRRAD